MDQVHIVFERGDLLHAVLTWCAAQLIIGVVLTFVKCRACWDETREALRRRGR